MKYFETLPKILYTDKNYVSKLYTNIMARASFVSKIKESSTYFYTYDIQDEDTPEIVAYKYYGDSYRYWIVLYFNNVLDPLWDWPLSNRQFEAYIAEKYPSGSDTDLHHYEKYISQYDINTQVTTLTTLIIDEDEFNNFTESTTTYSLPTGNVVVTTTAKPITNYEYELSVNDSKKSIKILNKMYAQEVEKEMKKLMGT